MGGRGTFTDARLGINVTHSPDLVNSQAPGVARAYQHSLPVPRPAATSFDSKGAASGRSRVQSELRDVPRRRQRHRQQQQRQASQAGRNRYGRSLRGAHCEQGIPHDSSIGLSQHPPYFHDGNPATCMTSSRTTTVTLALQLTGASAAELVDYLKSL